MRHAYYLASEKACYLAGANANEYGHGLAELYESFGITEPTKFDGASRYDKNGKIHTVVMLKNFFPAKDKNGGFQPCGVVIFTVG